MSDIEYDTFARVSDRGYATRQPRELAFDEATRIAAGVLRRLRSPGVGADRQNPGCYEVFFLDADNHEEERVIRSVGLFESPRKASEAIPFIVAESILEEVSAAGWSA